ncbi:MAG TPA: serine hydrolase [Burkholderiaceae bacterium]|nr:serine hydrolase [Burkholderiaceae bacterium]
MASFRDAIAHAVAHEIDWARDPAADPDRWGIHLQDPPPWNVLRGPVHARGPSSGVVLHRGREVASWGEPDRADLTFSIAKTYLALLAGVAHDAGLLPDPDEPVRARLPGIGFDSPQNATVTWTHLLQQTSEWEGSCLGLPDTVDRWRVVQYGGAPAGGRKGDPRPLRVPGTYWEYNDVRINQLSLALLHLFGRPLPEVFDEAIMRPVGATSAWRWVGYDDAWIDLPDGRGGARRVQSVPGGTHWGGGVSISARDQARIGAMLLAGGTAGERRVLSSAWIERMLQPCAIAPWYGMLVWLNAARRPVYPSAGRASWFMLGAGGHATCGDPERGLVVASRWVDPAHTDRLYALIGAALDASSDPAVDSTA